ncbi:SIR2 family protein [Bradyrhizobium sp. 150]|uniref:SIR2 family NAD-dependent protein deacylase n=1 Tax=Bradyrhizobium sp. 150 TaxID=2782625 RepID=UPI001FF7B86E|nr:SIR2 family protein [Bradyrhizobium sp. 150]MCK1677749.1 SIR2 family protein [Bradyrhizobium sp. 150]
MVESVQSLINRVEPERTVLMFGAGSSVPSRAPTSQALIDFFARRFTLPEQGFTLPEIGSLAERKAGRKTLIAALREQFRSLKPTGGLLNLPLYNWRSLYTTNYDDLIEQTYKRRELPINVYSSDFDFGGHENALAQKVFKLHGTIEKDVVDGDRSRIILTDGDYDLTSVYREQLYARLKSDLAGAMLIIIGHSLVDPDIREIANKAANLNAQLDNGGQIVLFLYTPDDDRAGIFEGRGLTVCFGGIDDFFAGLTAKKFNETPVTVGDDPLDRHAALRPASIDVAHASDPKRSDVGSMFNGRPASHADVLAGLTFERTVSAEIWTQLASGASLSATLLGASGVGKTTAARQVLQKLRSEDVWCWEHKQDMPFTASEWFKLAADLRERGLKGVLLIDDAHQYLFEINDLADRLLAADNPHLKLFLVATRHQWNPRIKSATLYKFGKEFRLSRLSGEEIERLLQLVDITPSIKKLIEPQFNGFSRAEKRLRLVDRCEADMFVCLRSIFASDNFDDIILREYADLAPPLQDIYRYVAALENAGVKVHRQLLIRLLHIPASSISAVLDGLTDIVTEYDVSTRESIYAWRARHAVIANIITRYKFNDIDKIVSLFENVIRNLQPTYDIEVSTIRELCNVDTGIPSIPSKETQNRLLRMMISAAPGVRVPRHRLIRNLIASGDYDKAETEIRVFESDFSLDGPVYRYKVDLLVARASKSPGLMSEDRVTILEEARDLALTGMNRFALNKSLLASYAEVGVQYYKIVGTYDVFDDAMSRLREADEKLGDPDLTRVISRLERRIQGQATEAEVE